MVGCLLVSGTLGLPLNRVDPVSVNGDERTAALQMLAPQTSPLVRYSDDDPEEFDLSLLSRLRRLQPPEMIRPTAFTYTVEEGDSIWSIAERLDTDMDTLLEMNTTISPELIQPGQSLNVVEHFRGVAYLVEEGDTLEQIAAMHGVPLEQVETANRIASHDQLEAGRFLFLPGARPRPARGLVASRGSAARERSALPESSLTQLPAIASLSEPLIWPIAGGLVTSEFGGRWGSFHSGIDIAGFPEGTPAVAALSGTVTFAGWDGGYGYCVIMEHEGGVKTRYAHASAIFVTAGQQVDQGTPVIAIGSTGHSTGPHLHFEIVVDDAPQNPRNYLR